MNNFILWNTSQEHKRIQFLATGIGIHYIHLGTDQMVFQMMEDLGFEQVEIEKWSLKPYLCNYMLDSGDTDWEDIWAATWEVTIHYSGSTMAVSTLETDELIYSDAYDDGIQKSANNCMFYPVNCLVVGDFAEQEDTLDCAEHLTLLIKMLSEGEDVSTILEMLSDPDVDDVYKEVFNHYKSYKLTLSKRHVPNVNISVKNEKQLFIDFGALEKNFYQQGALFAQSIIKLIETFDGTTTWNQYIYQNSENF